MRLADVVSEAQGGFASGERDTNGVAQLRMNNVTNRGSFDWSSVVRVPVDVETVERFKLEPGDVLFNNTNSTELVGKSALFVHHDEPVTFSNHFTRLRTIRERLCPEYLVLWLRGEWQNGLFAAICNRWIGQSALQRDKLLSLELPLPPLPEQERIAGLVAEQMAAVERARAAAEAQLEAAKALLAAYLREVFCAVEARRWPCVPLGEASEIVSGITLGRKLSDERVRPIAYLRVANVKDAYLDLIDVYTIEATNAEIERLRLRDGDLLLTEGGDPDKLGRGACWRGEIAECIHQNHIFRVRLDPKQVLPEFVSAQVASQYGKAYFLANAKQTTGIATINQRVLAAFPLMIPRLEEQGRVTAALAACTERAEWARKAAETQAAAINALPAALLRRAFSGEL